ncbi:peptidoglycan-binding protein [Fictibacillus enclensis]|uniref:peptidoglycan-binding protein n=1 Tax=Fictibacillus enclensis TaxID=1017270 RepID=UPI0025A182C1|nr:peptidoglycan-binding protein [Fictibacillus enclensis]MDM5336521.1 peptidoglycan-binding protein [Fictibacillus enclensis]
MKKWLGLFMAAVLCTGLLFPGHSSAALGSQMLSQGSSNSDVVVLQEYLMTKGVFPYHTATGYYGPITKNAVEQFQTQSRIKVDGIAGSETINKIKVLRKGDIGKPVIELQRLLKAWNAYSSTVDGIYGDGTVSAVASFQKNHGLSADGIAGPSTYKKLRQKSPSFSTRSFTVNSSAYTADCDGCSGKTKMGIDLKKYSNGKVVAVDPDVIPLGSKVVVEGYGTAIAADIGGGINGKMLDVFIADHGDAINWGRKDVKVTVYEN